MKSSQGKRANLIKTKMEKHKTDNLWQDSVTVLIKTFERPNCVKRLIKTIRQFYPTIAIVVCDDSRQPLYANQTQPEANLTWLTLPFEDGHTLGAGRNHLIDSVNTEYVFLCDDDHEFTAQTDLYRMWQFLDQSGYDIVGGAQGNKEYGASVFERKDGKMLQKFNQHYGLVATYTVACDRVSNTFLARRTPLARVRWQADVYAHEHADFFIRCKNAGIKVAQMGRTWVDHDRGCEAATGLLGKLFGRWLSHQDGFYRKLRMGAAPDGAESEAAREAKRLYKKYVLDVHQVSDINDIYNRADERALMQLIGRPDQIVEEEFKVFESIQEAQ